MFTSITKLPSGFIGTVAFSQACENPRSQHLRRSVDVARIVGTALCGDRNLNLTIASQANGFCDEGFWNFAGKSEFSTKGLIRAGEMGNPWSTASGRADWPG